MLMLKRATYPTETTDNGQLTTDSFMVLQVQQFLLPKDGAEASECEDAIGVNMAAGRFAVADGATEAFDARSWAQLLAEGWVACEPATLTTEAFGAWVA